MATSKISIINSALSLLGHKTVTSLTENDTVDRISNAYDQLRDEALTAGPETDGWKFAKHTKEGIAVDATAPEGEYNYRYAIPSNPFCLKLFRVEVAGTELRDWVREGQYVLTNEEDEEVDMVYTFRVTNPTHFPPHFVKVLYYMTALHFCMSITQSRLLRREMLEEFEVKVLPRARGHDAREHYVQEYNEDYIDAGR